jgi:alginate O-acetyltransferase complex protein AlgI
VAFNTYLFACLFAVVLAVHSSPLGWTAKKLALLVFSYVFYAAWDPAFVVLLWGSTVVDWFVAQAMMRAPHPRRRKLLLAASLAFNLGLLGYFKYAGFLQRSIAALAGAAGIRWTAAPLDVALPIGISFYTFMTLSYTIDVYLGRGRPARRFLDYALYVTFFPHLISGPIVRATELVPQFETPRRADAGQLGWGLALVAIGLFEKVALADGILAPLVDKVYQPELAQIATSDAWAGTVSFAGQIFCDFAGYSTCAIGVALCLGFALPDNFRAPYAAVGIAEFWRRWHMSLSSWLRDYLYIPLGGSRRGALRTHANLALTMLIGGLWHGASWTFVAWGALHGCYLIGERLLRAAVPPSRFWRTTAVQLALALFTFALVCFAWVLFRATSFAQAFRILAAMLGAGHGVGHPGWWLGVIPVAGLVATHWVMRASTLEAAVERAPWFVRSVALAAALLSLFLFSGIDRAFLYFQF